MVKGALVVLVAALVAPSLAHAYGWPVKPFYRMHPIRGGFDDPRFHVVGGVAHGSFHFGIDISCPDGSPVYAVEPGLAVTGPDWVSVRRPNRREFGYWHVHPAVRSGSHVRLHQLLGYVIRGWGHVHFAEAVAGVYRNPLRPGGLWPFRQQTPPVVDAIFVDRLLGHQIESVGPTVSGTVALVAESYDLPPVAPPPPWQPARLVPALVRWRLLSSDADFPPPWQVAVDFRKWLYPTGSFDSVYAPGTWQNKGQRQGQYRFWLTQALDSRHYPNGTYWLQVESFDQRGNVGLGEITVTIAN